MRDGRLEISLDILISALCRDYERRQKAIEGGDVPRRTDTEFRYLNFKIYDACAECVGEERCEIMIREIGEHIGYAKSELWDMSEVTYKKYKQKAKWEIARALHLL